MDRTQVALCIALAWTSSAGGQDLAATRLGSGTPSPLPGFVENAGQWPSRIRFAADAGTCRRSAFTRRGFEIHCGGAAPPVEIRFERARSDLAIEAFDERPEKYHFFRSRDRSAWRTHVPSYRSLRYRGMYEGVDVIVRASGADSAGSAALFEYDLELSHGARTEDIAIRCRGIERLELTDDGGLLLKTERGAVRQLPPRTWRETPSGTRIPTRCRYRLLGPDRFGFEVDDAQDAWLRLVIDPLVGWALPLGTSGPSSTWLFDRVDGISAIRRTRDGEIVIVGERSAFDFPEEPPAGEECIAEEETAGDFDAYVLRTDAGGNALSVTILGGAFDDCAAEVALTEDGDIALAGYTQSAEFPVTDGSALAASQDGFIAVLDREACEIRFGTFVGGWAEDCATSIAVGPAGEIVASGYTASNNFPTTRGAMYPVFRGGASDQFFLRLTPPGASGERQVDYASYFGGNSWDARTDQDGTSFYRDRLRDGDIAVRGGWMVVAVGRTWSTDLPTTSDAFRRSKPVDFSDGFIGLFRLDGSLPPAEQIVYLSYLGGDVSGDAPRDLELASDGSVWVTGITWCWDYPTTPDAYHRTITGGVDVFLTRIRFGMLTGAQIIYSTFLGGSADEWDATLALKSDELVVIGAETESQELAANLGSFSGGMTDGLLMALDTKRPGLAALDFLGYIGGWGRDDITAVVPDDGSRVHVGLNTQAGIPLLLEAPLNDVGVVAALDIAVPIPVIKVEPPVGEAPFHALLDGTASTTPDGTRIEEYLWDLGVGDSATGATVERTFDVPGRYPVRLTVVNDFRLKAVQEKPVLSLCPSGEVVPWISADIGTPAFPGSSRRDGEAMDLCVGGRGISSAGDELRFVYREVDGDFEVTARLSELEGGNPSAGAGPMVRAGLGAKDPFVGIFAESQSATSAALLPRCRWRLEEGINPTSRLLDPDRVPRDPLNLAPMWLRIRRAGDEVSVFASRSADGSFADAPDCCDPPLSLPGPVLVGVAAFGRDGDDPTKALRPLQARLEGVRIVPDPDGGAGPEFIRGDANSDGNVDISDGVTILGYLFLGGETPTCLDAADADDKGEIVITDAIYVLNHLFVGGTAPPPPYPGCGEDPTGDTVDCGSYGSCD